jgi:hypothetical protein
MDSSIKCDDCRSQIDSYSYSYSYNYNYNITLTYRDGLCPFDNNNPGHRTVASWLGKSF